nr:hypothetical protein [Tanacetum cinerariifolium]
IVYDHQTHQHKGLIRELMIEGIVTDMAMVVDMETETGMEIIEGVVIDREVTDMVMAMTNGVLVLRGCGMTRMEIIEGVVIDREVTNMVMAVTNGVLVIRGYDVTRINRFGANSMVVLMGHRAKGYTKIMPHLPHVPFVGNFIRERHVTELLVLALNMEKLDIWIKIIRNVVQAAGGIRTTSHRLRMVESLH